MDEKTKTIMMEVSRIIPYDRNPRINSGAVEFVKRSISNYGFINPIIVDKNGVIVCGHTRYLAAKSLHIERVPVIFATWLTDEQISAYRIDDNRTSEKSEWDFAVLRDEMMSLDASGYDVYTMCFDQEELDRMLENGKTESEENDIPAIDASSDFDSEPRHVIEIELESESERQNLFIRLSSEGYKCSMRDI